MIRKALIGTAMATFCLAMVACEGGDDGGDPAKMQRRPQPTEKIEAPGPKQAEQKKDDATQGGG